MDEGQGDPTSWSRIGIVVVVVAVLGISTFLLLGTQVSQILSTVGSSVSPGGIVGAGSGSDQGADGGDAAHSGEGAGSDSEGASGGGGDSPAVPDLLDAGRPDLLIVKTGEVSIQATALGPAVETVTQRIVALGGYASGSSRSGKGEQASASVTFRVPADQWEAALAAARGAGDDVLGEHSETVDVTADVVDLKARIRNLEATETALQSIMARAGTIKDVLEVQSRLTDVQGEIEQLSSKAADLERRAAFSTLSVNVRLRPVPVIARQEARFDPAREAEGATAQLVGILQQVATAGIWFGIVWLPILTFLTVLGAVAFFVRRRLRGAGPGGGAPIEPSAAAGA